MTVGGLPWVFFILAWLAHGVLRVDAEVRDLSVSVMEGDTVTLMNDDKIPQQDRLMWYFYVGRIAYIFGDQTKICTEDPCKEGLRERLKLDQAGSLTITNIRTTDSGEYTLLIGGSSAVDRFNVSVRGVRNEIKRVSVKEEGFVDLYPPVPKLPDDVLMWSFNGTVIAEITGDQSTICTDVQCEERFRDRLKLDHQTGSLNITNTKTTDSGEYQLKITSNRECYTTTSVKSFSVSVTYQSDGVDRTSDPGSGLSPAAVAGVCVTAVALIVLMLAAAVGGWIYRRRSRKDGRSPRGSRRSRDVLLEATFPSSPEDSSETK